MSELRGNAALDSSTLIEYLNGTKVGMVLKTYFQTLSPRETVSISTLALAETFYVLCRVKSPEFASEKVAQMLASGVIEVSSSNELAVETGRLKCERSLSLADCSCLAAAALAKAHAVFAFRESELTREMRRKPFDVEIIFLEDLVS